MEAGKHEGRGPQQVRFIFEVPPGSPPGDFLTGHGGGEGGPAAGLEGPGSYARPRRVRGDRGLAQPGFRCQLGKHRDEPDAEVLPARFLGGVTGEEPDGGLGSGVAAA